MVGDFRCWGKRWISTHVRTLQSKRVPSRTWSSTFSHPERPPRAFVTKLKFLSVSKIEVYAQDSASGTRPVLK